MIWAAVILIVGIVGVVAWAIATEMKPRVHPPSDEEKLAAAARLEEAVRS